MMRIGFALALSVLLVSPSYANRLFTCGFEENDITTTLMWSNVGAGASIQTTTPHSGTYHAQLSGTSGKIIRRDLQTSLSSGTVYVRWYWRANSFSSTSRIFSNRSGGSTPAAQVSVTTSGTVTLTNAITTTATTSSATLSVDTLYRFELDHAIADAGGSMVLRFYAGDNASPLETLTISSEDTLPSNVSQFAFEESAVSASITSRFDDIAINDSAGSFQNTAPGKGSIYLLAPNSEVSTSFTPLSGTDNHLMVDDVPGAADDDTTYNSHGTANAEDRLGLTSLGGEVGSGDTIVLADVYGRIRGDTTTGTHNMRMLIWDEGGTQTNGPTTVLNDSTAFALMGTNDHLVLNTSGKTKANLDSFDVGYEPLTASNTFVTAVWVNVEWKAAAASGSRNLMLLGVGQ